MVVRFYPSVNPPSGRFRKRSIYAAGRGYRGSVRCGSLNGRGHDRGHGGRVILGRGGHVRGGCGGDIGAHENRIDISYFTRYFEDSEWAALSNNTSKRITEDPVRTKFLANKKRRTTSSDSYEKDNKNQLISQIIAGVQNTIQNEYVLEVVVTRFPTKGSRLQVSASNRGITSSNRNERKERIVVIYDHLGNLVTNT